MRVVALSSRRFRLGREVTDTVTASDRDSMERFDPGSSLSLAGSTSSAELLTAAREWGPLATSLAQTRLQPSKRLPDTALAAREREEHEAGPTPALLVDLVVAALILVPFPPGRRASSISRKFRSHN